MKSVLKLQALVHNMVHSSGVCLLFMNIGQGFVDICDALPFKHSDGVLADIWFACPTLLHYCSDTPVLPSFECPVLHTHGVTCKAVSKQGWASPVSTQVLDTGFNWKLSHSI